MEIIYICCCAVDIYEYRYSSLAFYMLPFEFKCTHFNIRVNLLWKIIIFLNFWYHAIDIFMHYIDVIFYKLRIILQIAMLFLSKIILYRYPMEIWNIVIYYFYLWNLQDSIAGIVFLFHFFMRRSITDYKSSRFQKILILPYQNILMEVCYIVSHKLRNCFNTMQNIRK